MLPAVHIYIIYIPVGAGSNEPNQPCEDPGAPCYYPFASS